MKSILNLPSVSGVYMIENTITNQAYIGSSANIKKRCNSHRCLLNNGKHTNIKLQRSYIKYGADAFSFTVLAVVDTGSLLEKESDLVDSMRPFFNIRIVVQSNMGTRLSDITKKKMSDAHKGKPLSLAQMAALSNLHKKRIGKPVTGKVKESLRLGPISLIGKHLSQETKMKISLSRKGKKFNKLTRKYE